MCSELQTSGDETAFKPMSETTLAANKRGLKTTLFAVTIPKTCQGLEA